MNIVKLQTGACEGFCVTLKMLSADQHVAVLTCSLSNSSLCFDAVQVK